MSPIRAITFDLWDTVFVDDSDEPKRAERGLPPKPLARRRLVHEFLQRHEPISPERVDAAYGVTDAAFRHVWYNQNLTWSVRERLEVLLGGLQRKLPPSEMDELVRLHEEMELAVRPELAPHVAEALAELAGKYRLGVISDTVFSPGRALRELLGGYGLLRHFGAFCFSDELGRSKPDPIAFHKIAEALGVGLGEIVHVGDREEKDVDGAHAVGARAVLVTMVKDRRKGPSRAEAVCGDYRQLAGIIERMDSEDGFIGKDP